MIVIDDEPRHEEPAPPATDELEEAKIRRVARQRRAQVRTRGYYLAMMTAAWVIAAQLIWAAGSSVSATDMHAPTLGYVAGAIALVWVGWKMRQRAAGIARAIQTSALPEPEKPPDFSGLG